MFEFITNNKEWVFSGIGIAIASLLLSLAKIAFNFSKLLKSKSHRFEGVYESFNCRIKNDGTFLKSGLRIHKTIFGELKAEFNSYRYRYVGEVRHRGHNVYIDLSGINHDGYMHCVFKEPLGSFDILIGVFSAITSNRLPVCGRLLLKKTSASSLLEITPSFIEESNIDPRIASVLNTNVKNLDIVEDFSVYLIEEIRIPSTPI